MSCSCICAWVLKVAQEKKDARKKISGGLKNCIPKTIKPNYGYTIKVFIQTTIFKNDSIFENPVIMFTHY